MGTEMDGRDHAHTSCFRSGPTQPLFFLSGQTHTHKFTIHYKHTQNRRICTKGLIICSYQQKFIFEIEKFIGIVVVVKCVNVYNHTTNTI